jgi:hypothetical protein
MKPEAKSGWIEPPRHGGTKRRRRKRKRRRRKGQRNDPKSNSETSGSPTVTKAV